MRRCLGKYVPLSRMVWTGREESCHGFAKVHNDGSYHQNSPLVWGKKEPSVGNQTDLLQYPKSFSSCYMIHQHSKSQIFSLWNQRTHPASWTRANNHDYKIITEWPVWCPYMVKLGVYYFDSQAYFFLLGFLGTSLYTRGPVDNYTSALYVCWHICHFVADCWLWWVEVRMWNVFKRRPAVCLFIKLGKKKGESKKKRRRKRKKENPIF